jgi:hypothetical protein
LKQSDGSKNSEFVIGSSEYLLKPNEFNGNALSNVVATFFHIQCKKSWQHRLTEHYGNMGCGVFKRGVQN